MKKRELSAAEKYKLKPVQDFVFGNMRLINDHFENNKQYNVPRAQFIIADIPFNLGKNAYASNPMWYKDGDNKNGESDKAGKSFFATDEDFRIPNLFHFCSRLLKNEPKDKKQAPCMLVFCSWQQIHDLIECAKEYGFAHAQLFNWHKNYSAEVLKANMRAVGNMEFAVLFYKDKLPKFNNNGSMFFTGREWKEGIFMETIHTTQKPLGVLMELIEHYTDKGDVIIDPCCGSASTLIAAEILGRKSIGFEINKEFCFNAQNLIKKGIQTSLL